MERSVGVLAAEHLAVGLVEDNRVVGSLRTVPEDPGRQPDALLAMPAEEIARNICGQIEAVRQGAALKAVGVGFPGIIRDGVVQESPNLPQIKGFDLRASLSAALAVSGAPVVVFNDADVMAAGIAATRGQLHRLVRVWTLGNGIGFGRYPWSPGAWEGGHSVVTLDPKEHFCGCGGRGHLEGIMGHRAMRLRFLDMEPEEVFASAQTGDERCAAFVKLWHRALAAATANSIHMEGPGEFFVTGHNARFVEVGLLNRYLNEMVKMTPLQGSRFEVVATSDEVGVIGAAVNAERFAQGVP
ncbi:MAG TPA: ROK family protein [Terriglobia bacterium]